MQNTLVNNQLICDVYNVVFYRRIQQFLYIQLLLSLARSMKQMYSIVKPLDNLNIQTIKKMAKHKQPFNIFENSVQPNTFEFKLSKIRPHDIVGYQNLKHYQKLKSKCTRSYNRMMSTERSTACLVAPRHQEPKEFLKKHELYEKLPILSKDNTNYKIFLESKKVNKSLWAQQQQQQSKKYNNLSIRNLKRRYNDYKQQWQQFFSQPQSLKRQVTTLHESVNNYRLKIQEKQNQIDHAQITNVDKRSALWMKSLRNQNKHSLHKECKQRVKVVNRDRIEVKGVSKLHVQTEWIEQKDQEGCEFRFIQKQHEHEVKQQKQQQFT